MPKKSPKDTNALNPKATTNLAPTVPSTSIPVSVHPPIQNSTGSVSSLPVVALPPSVVPSVAEQIWSNIKDKPIQMFGLPNQTPSLYCQPIAIEPSKLYLVFTIGSVLPAMEEAFKSVYDVELMDRYIAISFKSAIPKQVGR